MMTVLLLADLAKKKAAKAKALALPSTFRHFMEAGALIGGLGCLIIIIGAIVGLRAGGDAAKQRQEKIAYIVGAFLIGVCFLLMLLGVRSK